MFKKSAIAVGLAMLMGSSAAWAGYKQLQPVVITPANNAFGGDMGSVRNTTDTQQYLHASFQVSQWGIYNATLYARDASGNSALCTTSDPKLIEVVRSITTDSFIMVYHDGAGTCTVIEVVQGSYNVPKQP